MKKQIAVLGFALSSVLLAPCSPTEAQPPAKVARVGFLDSSTAPGTELKGIEVSPEPSG
jgi:hypothetical protein